MLMGEWLKDGAHVNAAGGNHWLRREVDEETVTRSSVIVVDDLGPGQDGMRRPDLACGAGIIPMDQGRHVGGLGD